MKDSHFCYLFGLHQSQEPKLILKGAKAPWYRQISLIGLVATFAVLGIVSGLTTGLYSCSQKQEVKEVIVYEYPIGHTEEVLTAKPIERGSKVKNSRP